MENTGEDSPREPAFWPLYLMPFVVAGTALGAYAAGGFVKNLYTDLGFPLLLTTWVGMGFTFAWDSVRFSMHAERFPPLMVAAAGILGALFLLSMIGFESMWQEPWLFGVAVWPGFSMARPVLRQWWADREAQDGDSAPEGGQT